MWEGHTGRESERERETEKEMCLIQIDTLGSGPNIDSINSYGLFQ